MIYTCRMQIGMKIIKIIIFVFFVNINLFYGMEVVLQPTIPYDCIENIVYYSHIFPFSRACLAIVNESYDSYNTSVYNDLIKHYQGFESLRLVCKKADKWLSKIWYQNTSNNCCQLLQLDQLDVDVILQKSVTFKHPFCMTIAFKLGANVNTPVLLPDNFESPFGPITPIFAAVFNGDYPIAQWLIEQGAKTNVVVDGYLTPDRLARAIMSTYVKKVDRKPYEKILALLYKMKS